MGIGSAGTTAVDPSNPLYDAVKSGGGYVEDEETGEVTGGPDGDGTAWTEAERLYDSNNAMDAHEDADGWDQLTEEEQAQGSSPNTDNASGATSLNNAPGNLWEQAADPVGANQMDLGVLNSDTMLLALSGLGLLAAVYISTQQ
ncbi:hypothetical protein [Haloarcula onubensis]|uniref:Uncharacterized protein n=1 Tax=Haloarcula onubensis TaxID=2950539 RepID=A0ABU2FIQ0_9EURY|nr:hypothetical protein [Halomicroarcula sp. S3CR25-11]MDS0280636.1 hypothetical protein [Halomicroarcula sp. S3CR25-11]